MNESDSTVEREPLDAGSTPDHEELIDELLALRKSMLGHEARLAPWLRNVDRAHAAGAFNLAHYLAMQRMDTRRLQARLASIGVSSMDRTESNVLAGLDKVLAVLHRLAGCLRAPHAHHRPAGNLRDGALLEQHAEALFGPRPDERGVRIMTTLPGATACDDTVVEGLVAAGMDIARIDCAQGCAVEWTAMAESVRMAARRSGCNVRVLVDLAGAKLRTGAVAGPAVLKLKPARDAFGCVTAPARLGLRPIGSSATVPGAAVHLSVDAEWLERLEMADSIDLTDARSAHRRLTVVARLPAGALVDCSRTTYLTAESRLRLHRRGHDGHETAPGGLPASPGQILLQRGETLRLVRKGLGHGAILATSSQCGQPATVACTRPEVLSQLRRDERIWFDDGRIGAVVHRVTSKGVDLEITHAREGGERLGADMSIHLPDTRLDLPALTEKDIVGLAMVARHVDLVGLSCVQSAGDVKALRRRLAELGAAHIGLILKLETRRGFQNLPEVLFAAMACPGAGVMISRSDLALGCGTEHMTEVQEAIRRACAAAHLPVVWTTQALDALVTTGLPLRAEIIDAAMGGRPECVMLNQGLHTLHATRALDDILRCKPDHRAKGQSLLRDLEGWTTSPEGSADASSRPMRNSGMEAVPL